MTIWIDAPPSLNLAQWMTETMGVTAYSVAYLGLRAANDEIYLAAKAANAVVMIKDADFLELQFRFGAPPQIILIALGNTLNQKMRGCIAGAICSYSRVFSERRADHRNQRPHQGVNHEHSR